MTTKQQTDNQTSKVLTSIPDSIKDVISEADLKRAVQAIKDRKMILLNVEGENKKEGFAKLINNIIIDPKGMLTSSLKSALRTHNYPLKPSTIDRLEFDEEKKFLKELKKYINSHSWFYTLFINNLTDYNDGLAYILEKLKDSMEEKGRDYFKVSHPNKSEINKAILDKYKEYPILKQIKKEKNPAYQIKEHLRDLKELLRNKKYKKLALKKLNKKYKGKPALKAKALKALEIKAQKLNKLKRNIGVLKSYYSELKRNMRILKDHFGEYFINELTEDEKEEMKECSNDIFIDNKSKIEKIISEVKPREKNELYRLVMEKPPRSSIIINFHGKVPGKFRKRFQGEYEEIKVNDICVKEKKGRLRVGKGFKIPKEKFIGTLKETYNWCKKDEKENGEKWTGTKIAKYAMRLLKSRYGDKYDADFKQRYLENKFSEIKQRKL